VSNYDFGYILCRNNWGQGFATEAASCVVRRALALPPIFRVWATCHPANLASARVLEKSGLTYEGRLARWEPRPNLGEDAGDSLVYAATWRHEWSEPKI
jgi:[ribosomal protein S5]-alanine N-acetyltransferase